MNITFINKCKTLLDADFHNIVSAMVEFQKIYVKYWSQAKLDKWEVGTKARAGYAAFVFLPNADVANALGYHDITKHGMPLAKIFVETTRKDGEDVCVTATHELAEMLVDPLCTLTARGPKKIVYSYETADAVEETNFKLLNQLCTNFVLPTWFQNFKHPSGTKFDYLGLCKKPFQLLKGGYAAVYMGGEWTQIFGSSSKAERFSKEDRRGHRYHY